MFCECEVDGIGIGNGDGYTLSPLLGCFARGSVVLLNCVGVDTRSNAGSVNLDVSRRLLKEESDVKEVDFLTSLD